MTISEDTIKVTFLSQFRHAVNEITFERPNSFGIAGLHASSEWPHTEVTFLDGEGQVRLQATAANLLTSLASDYEIGENDEVHREFLDLDITYIGRAYGTNGNRNAITRLANHETLQRIQGEMAMKRPDLDLWLVPLSFQGFSIIGEFGTWVGTVTDAEERAHAEEVERCPIPESQRVALTEGALIKHFDPEYNKNLKGTFPSRNHKDYSAVYSRELIGAGFDLETTPVGTRIGSAKSPHSWAHATVFSLRTDSEKQSILDLSSPMQRRQ
ncbi:hypothetical protein [Streptomyces sp. NPDC048202]|uniref:hypothetical protein n=1 Tax=Streptomyces sp. NPDC048202 TaxID=3365514 RepID=UPI003715FC8F